MKPDPDANRYWCPNTNVFISGSGELIIKADLSGLAAADLEISVENQRLKIKGVRRDPEVNDSSQLLVKEIAAGPFESVLEVPDGFDLSAARSSYLNGNLRIVVPPKTRPPAAPGPTISNN